MANDNLERANVLLPKAIISQAAYDTRRNELDAAAAALDSAEAQLRQAVNAVGYTTLKADKAGIVTAVTGEPGQVVGAGQAVVSLADSRGNGNRRRCPRAGCGRLAIGQQAKHRLWAGPPRVSVDGRDSRDCWPGRPSFPDLCRSHCRETAAAGHAARDDRIGRAHPRGECRAAGGAPDGADRKRRRHSRRSSSTLRTRWCARPAVDVGGVAEDGVQIARGLQAGDMVVTAGVQFLRDGMRVRLPGERAQAAAT